MIERIASPGPSHEDENEPSLRPTRLLDFVGQEGIKANMKVFIQAALERAEPLDHMLISGPPGLGKTTFSRLVAAEMNANLQATSAPVIEKTGDMASLLSGLKEGDVLFIDEIHRLKPIIEETLYSAMEDFCLDINLGQGSTAKSVRISLPKFTLIGATTKTGALTQPLISRFGIFNQFSFYSPNELEQIARRNGTLLGMQLDDDGLLEVAKRSRGTPRILNRILRRIRDFAQISREQHINQAVASSALKRMEIDPLGLDKTDRRLLGHLIDSFGGGPVGLENLAIALGEDASNLEEVYEPYLIQTGFLKRTPRGRVATSKAYKYFGKTSPVASDQSLLGINAP